jgi:hypothetical protein
LKFISNVGPYELKDETKPPSEALMLVLPPDWGKEIVKVLFFATSPTSWQGPEAQKRLEGKKKTYKFAIFGGDRSTLVLSCGKSRQRASVTTAEE